MTKNSHVFSSISTIALIILPILFALGILLSEIIYPILTIYSDDCSLFFTISGIVILILLLIPPPPNKKKRSIFLYTIKSLWKKFVKPKLTEQVKFDNNVVYFATVQESTKDAPLDDKIINDNLAIIELSPLNDDQQPQNNKSIFSLTLRKNAKNLSFRSKPITPFKKIRSNFSKISLFKTINIVLVFALFLSGTNSTKMDWKSIRFGGAAFESRIKPQNQLQLEVKNAFQR